MSETSLITDFSAGWIPQDDPVNGRKNGLLKMDSIELDQNGALTMCGGAKNIFSTNYPADAHTLYSKFISGVQKRYLALTNGAVYRDSSSIISGGSATRAAFLTAFNYVFIFSADERYKDDGAAATIIGVVIGTDPTSSANGAGNLTGTYQWAVQSVYNHSNGYVAKSVLSGLSTPLDLIDEKADIVLAAMDATANETWVFRRGGNLDNWYRVAISTNAAGETITDNLSDLDAIALGEISNEFLATTDVTGLSDDVLEVIGLVNQRAILFTKSNIIFSELNSPDNYDTRYVIKYGGNQSTGSEIFLWAKKVGDNTIIIGTNVDVYILTGSYIALPDGYLDVYLRPYGTKVPPLGRDADVYNNSIAYMSCVGWILFNLDGSYVPLCPPTTDKLYRGQTIQGYGGVPIYIFPATDAGGTQLRYSCAIARNKLWCRVPQIVNNDLTIAFTYRMEVYDFIRKSWRPIQISPLLLYAQEDGAVMGFFNDSQRNLREIDHQFVKTNNGINQTVTILLPFNDCGSRRNRKEAYTLKFKVNTANANFTLTGYKNSDLNTPIALGTISSNGLVEVVLDIHTLVDNFKDFALSISGAATDFILSDISINYDLHPEALTFLKGLLPKRNLQFNKSKLVCWPFIIDTLGQDVTFTPYVDGVAGATSLFNTTSKRTVFYYASTELFGVDLDFTLGINPFELWEIGQPELVQALPIGKKFDQVGPEELFRYGKVRRFFIRLLAFGTTIPYKLYFQDGLVVSGNLTTVNAVEDTYIIDVPKTTAGQIVKIILGPTAFIFHRYYIRIQFAREGKDTENEYITLPAQQEA